MEYLIMFLQGILAFISPCFLPMLPIYITYFAGGQVGEKGEKRTTLLSAIVFVISFSIIFIILGAAAGTFGRILIRYGRIIDLVCGIIMILFGINYIGVIKIPLLNRTAAFGSNFKSKGILSSFLLGIVFAISWTPCLGVWLGAALNIAATSNSAFYGARLLAVYSLGLGVPFIFSAVLIDKMYDAFNFIKKHYKVINIISGVLLILMGVLMISGRFRLIMQFLTPQI